MILRPLPFVALDVTGDVDAVRHFEREYGSAALPEAVTARVSLGVGRAVAGAPPSIERWHGRYRTVGWNASVTNDAGSTRIAIELAGRPRWFGLSLVQRDGLLAMVAYVLTAISAGLLVVGVTAAWMALRHLLAVIGWI